MQFATNYMGHFALTVGLLDALPAAGGARIVVVSSNGNLISPVVFDDLHFDFHPYDGGRYFEDCNEAETMYRRPPDYHGVAHYALDTMNAARLWDASLAMIERAK